MQCAQVIDLRARVEFVWVRSSSAIRILGAMLAGLMHQKLFPSSSPMALVRIEQADKTAFQLRLCNGVSVNVFCLHCQNLRPISGGWQKRYLPALLSPRPAAFRDRPEGNMSRPSATSSMIARLIMDSPEAKPASRALSQRLLSCANSFRATKDVVMAPVKRGRYVRLRRQQPRSDVAIRLFNVWQFPDNAAQGIAVLS